MQTLKLSEKERDDSKVLLTLGKTFQKEFDKLRCVRYEDGYAFPKVDRTGMGRI